jgi:hypothetical protein
LAFCEQGVRRQAPVSDWSGQKDAKPCNLVIIRILTNPSIPYSHHDGKTFSPTSKRIRLRSTKSICELTLGLRPSVLQVERAEEDKVCDAGCRIGEPALCHRAGCRNPVNSCVRAHSQPRLKIKVGACAAVNVNGQYNMQDPNHWYSLQRSNTGQHAYSVQDSASNTPTLPPAGLHDNQALSPVYPFGSAMRPAQGESFSLSLDTIHLLYNASVPSSFPSIHGRAFAFSCTAPIFQHEWHSFPFT